jgi:hypothetical protein
MMDDSGCIFLLLRQFIPELKTKNIKFPVVLYLDGNCCHINIIISDICSENDIELIFFPPNTTFILRPYTTLLSSSHWKGCGKIGWMIGQARNPRNQVNFKNVAHLLNDVWQKLPLMYGQNGFRACGLYPWNSAAVR